jgi:sodium-dependent dicarboxylate transporter 2/3/5
MVGSPTERALVAPRPSHASPERAMASSSASPASAVPPVPPTAKPPREKMTRHLIGAPVAFALCLLAPLPLPFEARGAIGLLVWMSWWWIAGPVDMAVTGLLPLAVTALFGLAPMDRVLGSYAEETIILLLGANVLTSVWSLFGLDRRIALTSLLSVGTSTTRQILIWFTLAAALSAILPNTIVAATMIPIVVAMLRFIGIDDLKNSKLGTALVLAIAWGTSAGGAGSPLGGAPNLLTVNFIEESITGREFLFITWVTRLLPITLVICLVMFLFLRFALKPEMAALPGSKDFFRKELKALSCC